MYKKKYYFTKFRKTNIQQGSSRLVKKTLWYNIYSTTSWYMNKIHARISLGIGPDTIDANKGIKPSRWKTSSIENHLLEGSIFPLPCHLDRRNWCLLFHKWCKVPSIGCQIFHAFPVCPSICPIIKMYHPLERIQV